MQVRNPLACATAALNLAAAGTRELNVQNNSTKERVLDDLNVVDSSLDYVNNLLRSMLDMNKASSGQIKIEESPTDILRDVLQPSAALLSTRERGTRVEVVVDCPPDLIVETDQLRLKQMVLNLSVNASKFVERGFIRLRAAECAADDAGSRNVDVERGDSPKSVRLFIEDSGPGVPPEKEDHLFSEAFQESL